MLSFLNPYVWVSLPLLLIPFGRRFLYALPPLLFFLLGFLRAYSVLGVGEEMREGEGWYHVSVYDWGRGRITYRYGDRGWVRVRSKDLNVLMGDRPAFPTDDIVVSGRISSCALSPHNLK